MAEAGNYLQTQSNQFFSLCGYFLEQCTQLPNLKIPNTIRHESTQKNIPVQENKHFFLLS